jgi:hypothetical protein
MRVILASAFLLAAVPAFATTFLGGTVGTGTNVSLGALTDPQGDSDSLTGPGTITASSTSSVTDGTNSLSSFANVRGDWFSADSGEIQIQWGWDAAAGGSSDPTSVQTNLATNWSYTFTASGNGSFNGAYFVVANGDVFGLQPIYGADDMPFGPYGGTVSDPNGSGTFAVPLVSGQTYTMALYNFGNLSSEGGLVAVGGAGAGIGWGIVYVGTNGVPEPASWAMMVTGFSLIGAAARRRRAVHA